MSEWSWFRRHLGVDFFDLAIHVSVTMMLMVWVSISNGPQEFFPVITIASLIVLAVRRAVTLRQDRARGLTTGEMTAERIADLEQRMAELESAQARVAELEERLDFTERLLATSQAEPMLRLPREGAP